MTRRLLLILGLVLSLAACQRDPRYDEGGNVRLVIDIDREVLHEGTVPLPDKMIVLFFDTRTHRLKATRFTGPAGGEFYLESGEYDMLLYNFGTESTLIRNGHDWTLIEAYTSETATEVRTAYDRLMAALRKQAAARAAEDGGTTKTGIELYSAAPIVFEPDHLFANSTQRVDIPYSKTDGGTVVIHASARTILETYSIQIGPVTGLEHLRSANIFLTGQTRSNHFGRGYRSMEPATIYFPISPNAPRTHFYTVFRTFGKLPGAENRVFLDVELTDQNGQIHEFEWDVTDQFDDPGNTGHRIVIDVPIDIPAPTSGGFKPTVGEWDTDTTKVRL